MKLEEIHLKEFEKLQNEIISILSEIGILERFSVVSSGGLFAWLLTHTEEIGQDGKIGYFLPSILVICFGLIVLGLFYRLKLIGKYIKDKYEKEMNFGENADMDFGWESNLEKSLKNKGSLLANARSWMWIFLLIIDLSIAFYYTFYR